MDLVLNPEICIIHINNKYILPKRWFQNTHYFKLYLQILVILANLFGNFFLQKLGNVILQIIEQSHLRLQH